MRIAYLSVCLPGRCHSKWEYFQGSCYFFTSSHKTWSDAMKYCRDKGADLIKVTSAEENNFITRSGKTWWLALRRDAIQNNIFKWNDGSLPTFTDWGNGEPNNHANMEECAEILDTGKWNDIACHGNNRVYLACEKGKYNFIRHILVFGFEQTIILEVSQERIPFRAF